MSRKITNRETDDELRRLFYDTTLSYREIGSNLGLTYKQIHKDVYRLIPFDDIDKRRREAWGRAKQGPKNPMYRKFREKHHNYKGRCKDGKGYLIILRPEWYTAREGSKHVFEHHVVMCEVLGLTAIPKGFSVHHVDGDKTNNDPNNLALMTSGAHSRLHAIEKGWNVGRCNDHPERE